MMDSMLVMTRPFQATWSWLSSQPGLNREYHSRFDSGTITPWAKMSRGTAPAKQPRPRPARAAPGPPSSRRPGRCSSPGDTPRRPSRRSATCPIPRSPRCTGCSPPSSGSSKPFSTFRSPATTRRSRWPTAHRSAPWIQTQTQRDNLAGFAALLRELMARTAPVHRILEDAARSDQAAAALLADIALQRHDGQRRIARALARASALRSGLREREAADIIHALASPEVYRLLVVRPRLDQRTIRAMADLDPHRPAPPIDTLVQTSTNQGQHPNVA